MALDAPFPVEMLRIVMAIIVVVTVLGMANLTHTIVNLIAVG
jgi:hypothetical protein